MKLNEYQQAWIDRLLSGKTRKCRMELSNGCGGNCCLGVAINVCKLETIRGTLHSDEDLGPFKQTKKALNLDKAGTFKKSKLSKKWLKKLEEKYKNKNHAFLQRNSTLIDLNDAIDMSHKEIVEFINENREAVFWK